MAELKKRQWSGVRKESPLWT